MRLILVAVILLSGIAAQAQAVRCIDLFQFVDGLDHRALNPSASRPPDQYLKPNRRSLEETNSILLGTGKSLTDFVNDGDTVIDIGAGQAQAMAELAGQKKIKARVIDTYDQSSGIPSGLKGSVKYLVGWAEDILRRVPGDVASLVIDVWGGFSYSPKKDIILEETYRVLKVGGVAKILFVPGATPAKVQVGEQQLDLHVWLAKTYPQIFQQHRSDDPDLTQPSYVITMTKPNPAPFRLGLKLTEVTRVSGGELSSVVYQAN
jgi:ubiquinone/menaquinone biosynthesis C-methylase UbiE